MVFETGLLAKGLFALGGMARRFGAGASRGVEPVKLTPIPVAEIVAPRREPHTPAEPHPDRLSKDAETVLREIGLPPCFGWTGKRSRIYDGPLRVADTPEDAARRFVVWLRAIEETGEYRPDQVLDLFWVFCTHDHREQCNIANFLAALKRRPKSEVRFHQLLKNNKQRTYTITPGKVKPLPVEPEVKGRKPKPAMHTALQGKPKRRKAKRPGKAGNVVQLSRAA